MQNDQIKRVIVSSIEDWKKVINNLFSQGYHWTSQNNSEINYHEEYFYNENARVLYFYATSPNYKIIMRGGLIDPHKIGIDHTDEFLSKD